MVERLERAQDQGEKKGKHQGKSKSLFTSRGGGGGGAGGEEDSSSSSEEDEAGSDDSVHSALTSGTRKSGKSGMSSMAAARHEEL